MSVEGNFEDFLKSFVDALNSVVDALSSKGSMAVYYPKPPLRLRRV